MRVINTKGIGDYRCGPLRMADARDSLPTNALANHARAACRLRSRVCDRARAAQNALTPPSVDEGNDHHRPDNHEQEPGEFGVEHARV